MIHYSKPLYANATLIIHPKTNDKHPVAITKLFYLSEWEKKIHDKAKVLNNFKP